MGLSFCLNEPIDLYVRVWYDTDMNTKSSTDKPNLAGAKAPDKDNVKPTEDILRQVIALLAKTEESGCTVNEAAAAAALAQKLMLKYNISETALSKNEASAVAEHTLTGDKVGKRYEWKKELLDGICKTNFCMPYGSMHEEQDWDHEYERRYGKKKKYSWKATIIGQENDAQLVVYLFNYLFREINRQGYKEFWKAWEGKREWDYDAPSARTIHTWMQDFGPAAVHIIVQRLGEQRQSQEAEVPSDSKALIVARDALVEDYYYRKMYNMSKAEKSAHDKATNAAYHAGAKMGEAGEPYDKSRWEGQGDNQVKIDEEIRYFYWGYQNGKSRYDREQLEHKYQTGELKRPKTRKVYTRLRASYGPGRRTHQTDLQARIAGERVGREITIAPGVEQTSKTTQGTRRIG